VSAESGHRGDRSDFPFRMLVFLSLEKSEGLVVMPRYIN
jgi:hypothetical protein